MAMKTTRRTFLSASAAMGVWVSTRAAAQPTSANEKLDVAVVGVARQGAYNLDRVQKEKSGNDIQPVNIVALADVDSASLGKAAEPLKGAQTFSDFRKMLDTVKNVDAVVVATPDHTHAFATMAALRMGKHVYCEKPLTHSVWECRQVMEQAKKAKVATQMGTQIHAGENYRRVVELIKAGAIGAVSRVHVFVPGFFHGGERPATKPVPANLDWDLWLGPAPHREYHDGLHPFQWRGWWDFGGGQLADLACHHIDLSHWALDLRTPLSVQSVGPQPHRECPPKWLEVDYHYAARGSRPAVHLTWYHGERKPPLVKEGKIPKEFGAGTIFVGEKGMLVADYNRLALLPEEQFKDYQRPEKSIPKSIGHHAEWIKACREGTATTCNFEYSGALTETVLLGNVSHRLGNVKIEWDSANLRATNSPEADKFLKGEYRKGWVL